MAYAVEVLEDRAGIVGRALALILERIKAKAGEPFTLVLAGGSTPKPLYEALAQESLDWSNLHVFWGDERFVPPTDPQSNEGMVRQAWLSRVNFPEAHIHPMGTGFASPEEAATNYQAHLAAFFAMEPPLLPSFDLVLLGMGDDGHTASLFPLTGALTVTDRWVTVGQKDDQPRLTLTYPILNNAKQILFLVSGSNKNQALRAVHAPVGDSNLYPSRLIQGNVLWLIDRDAYGSGIT
jgi:6-phosphogluconolactonase